MRPRPWLLLFLLPSLAAVPALRAEIVERVIAKVNGDIVTLSEFEARQIAAVQAARIPAADVETWLRDNNARLLQESIDDVLLMQRAAELGIKMRPDYVDDVVANIRKENNIQSDADLVDQLRREGMTLSDLRRSIERSVVRRQVITREVEPKAQPTEKDLREAYDKRRDEYRQKEGIHLQEIVLKGEGALEKARDLAKRARGGEDFAGLAKAHSTGPTAEQGGDLGIVPPADLAKDVAAAAALLQPGGISEPLSTRDGAVRILKLVERRSGSDVPFELAKTDLQKKLVQEKLAEAYEVYVANLRKNATVDLRVREVPLQLDNIPASTLAPPPVTGAGAPATDDEFSVSPQARPERVAPAAPASPAPSPAPGAQK